MIALIVALATLVAMGSAARLHRANRDGLAETWSHRTQGERFVVRIDPPRVAPSVRRAFWGVLAMSGVGIVLPLWSFTPDAVTAVNGLAWLVAIGGLAQGLWAYDRGLLWPAPSLRLGVTADAVWWDHVDRQAQPGPGPTSVARRTRRRDATLEQEGAFAVVKGTDGRGVVFGPLPPAAMRALREGWVS